MFSYDDDIVKSRIVICEQKTTSCRDVLSSGMVQKALFRANLNLNFVSRKLHKVAKSCSHVSDWRRCHDWNYKKKLPREMESALFSFINKVCTLHIAFNYKFLPAALTRNEWERNEIKINSEEEGKQTFLSPFLGQLIALTLQPLTSSLCLNC